MALSGCKRCGFVNSPIAKFCNDCGERLDPPALQASTSVQIGRETQLQQNQQSIAYKAGMLWASIGSGTRLIILIVVGLFVLVLAISALSGGSKPDSPTTQTPVAPVTASTNTRPAENRSSAHLSNARMALEGIVLQDDIETAKGELGAIPQGDQEYTEAQSILSQIKTGKIKPLPDIPGYEGESRKLYTTYIEIDPTITYDKLKKNPDRYAGSAWAFTGKVLEIYERGNTTIGRVGLGAWGTEPVWVEGAFTTDFVEDSRVYVIGHITGSKTYDSQAGWTITIPSLAADGMLKPGDAARLRVANR